MTAQQSLACTDDRRRRRVRRAGRNGIDAIDVSPNRLVLTVTFLDLAPADLTKANVRIDGGTRITGILAEAVHVPGGADPDQNHDLEITLSQPGDLSAYTLRLVEADEHGHPGTQPLSGFDPRYAQAGFSFAAGCPTDLDCLAADHCPPPAQPEPETSYLAKDYASFRQLILDRLALIMPAWTERHVPDIGITLVELLAYVADYLSYYQDAVATEAYLGTARKRISVRRHARLVDYAMHDGCNARAWVHLEVSEPRLVLHPGEFFFIAGDRPQRAALAAADLPATGYEAFEPVSAAPVEARLAHNQISFWTWGDEQCCLNAGATSATLKDPGTIKEPELNLHPGDVLILAEVAGPRTGAQADADPAHRQAVRLTKAQPGSDTLYNQPVVEIEWAPEDALTFPLCLSAIGGPPDCQLVQPAVAYGNVLLADHGRAITSCGEATEPLEVPAAVSQEAGCAGVGDPADPVAVLPRFDLPLARQPVTQRVPFPLPEMVGAGQAARLAGIPDRALSRVRELWQAASGGKALSDKEIGELRVIFGDRALADAHFPFPPRRPRRPPSPAGQAAALRDLLIQGPRLLARKTRWLEGMARRARAGLQLGPTELDEIRDAWGAAYAGDIAAASPLFAGPARDALRQDPVRALPAVKLRAGAAAWTPRRDLLGSGPGDRHFVAELDDDGTLRLRFGDGLHGRVPAPAVTFLADYRIGNGSVGNVGADVINQIVFCGNAQDSVTKVSNPLPAAGGTDPEPVADVRLLAPETFKRRLRRAVTADDYAALAGRLPGLQRAAARLRWTGSWYEAEVAVDPLGTEDADERLLEQVAEGLFRYRRIGHDLVVQSARYVPLLLELRVCVLPHFLRGHVQAAVQDAFSSRLLPDGSRGFFHPDNLTFGEAVDVSRIVALAQSIPGVQNVQVLRLERFGDGDHGALAQGYLPLGPEEIARLDGDPVFPENGQLLLRMGGGR
jgi:predicted phage baseplate assembly protein